MKLFRLKTFSGYDSTISGSVYIPAQVITEKIFNPIDNALHTIESTSLEDIKPIHKRTMRISKGLVDPLKYNFNKFSERLDKK